MTVAESSSSNAASATPQGIAFEELYREHAGFTWSVLRRLGVPPAALDDALQEVWLLVHRHRERLHSLEGVRHWLFQIARRVASHHRRKHARHVRKLETLTQAQQPTSAWTSPRDSTLVIESWLTRLDEPKRIAFVLSELEGWTAPEIADATGANVNTVYSRLRLAKQQLRDQLRADDAALEALLADARAHDPQPERATHRAWLLLVPQLSEKGPWSLVASWSLAKSAVVASAVAGTLVLAQVGLRLLPGVDEAEPDASDRVAHETPPREDGVCVDPVHAATQAEDADAVARTAPAAPRPATPSASLARDAAPKRRVPGKLRKAREPKPPSMADDAELLAAARQALARERLHEAHALLERHRARFPKTQLEDARELLHIELLCREGERDKARSRAAAIARHAPGSALAKRATALCDDAEARG